MKKTKKMRLLAGISILLMAGVFFVYRLLTASDPLNYVIATSGTITHEVRVQAIYANQETVLKAVSAGNVSFAGPDGLRLRRDEIALTIQPTGANQVNNAVITPDQNVYAPVGGLLYHTLDGLETIMTPDNLVSMDLTRLLQEQPLAATSDSVQVGQPVGKIVDNLNPTSAFIALPRLDAAEVGKTLRFSIEGQQQTAKVMRKSEAPQGVVVQFNQFIADSVSRRIAEILWIERPSVSGTVIPSTAVVDYGEEQGAYIVSGGVIQFRTIRVLDDNGEQACVEKIPVGMYVVANPRDGLEGKVVRK